jgi:hypothetical protein
MPLEFGSFHAIRRRLLMAQPETYTLEQQLDRLWSGFVE